MIVLDLDAFFESFRLTSTNFPIEITLILISLVLIGGLWVLHFFSGKITCKILKLYLDVENRVYDVKTGYFRTKGVE